MHGKVHKALRHKMARPLGCFLLCTLFFNIITVYLDCAGVSTRSPAREQCFTVFLFSDTWLCEKMAEVKISTHKNHGSGLTRHLLTKFSAMPMCWTVTSAVHLREPGDARVRPEATRTCETVTRNVVLPWLMHDVPPLPQSASRSECVLLCVRLCAFAHRTCLLVH